MRGGVLVPSNFVGWAQGKGDLAQKEVYGF